MNIQRLAQNIPTLPTRNIKQRPADRRALEVRSLENRKSTKGPMGSMGRYIRYIYRSSIIKLMNFIVKWLYTLMIWDWRRTVEPFLIYTFGLWMSFVATTSKFVCRFGKLRCGAGHYRQPFFEDWSGHK